jgi:hypothetical protein
VVVAVVAVVVVPLDNTTRNFRVLLAVMFAHHTTHTTTLTRTAHTNAHPLLSIRCVALRVVISKALCK